MEITIPASYSTFQKRNGVRVDRIAFPVKLWIIRWFWDKISQKIFLYCCNMLTLDGNSLNTSGFPKYCCHKFGYSIKNMLIKRDRCLQLDIFFRYNVSKWFKLIQKGRETVVLIQLFLENGYMFGNDGIFMLRYIK